MTGFAWVLRALLTTRLFPRTLPIIPQPLLIPPPPPHTAPAPSPSHRPHCRSVRTFWDTFRQELDTQAKIHGATGFAIDADVAKPLAAARDECAKQQKAVRSCLCIRRERAHTPGLTAAALTPFAAACRSTSGTWRLRRPTMPPRPPSKRCVSDPRCCQDAHAGRPRPRRCQGTIHNTAVDAIVLRVCTLVPQAVHGQGAGRRGDDAQLRADGQVGPGQGSCARTCATLHAPDPLAAAEVLTIECCVRGHSQLEKVSSKLRKEADTAGSLSAARDEPKRWRANPGQVQARWALGTLEKEFRTAVRQTHTTRMAYEEAFVSACLVRSRGRPCHTLVRTLSQRSPWQARLCAQLQEYQALEHERLRVTKEVTAKYTTTCIEMQPSMVQVPHRHGTWLPFPHPAHAP